MWSPLNPSGVGGSGGNQGLVYPLAIPCLFGAPVVSADFCWFSADTRRFVVHALHDLIVVGFRPAAVFAVVAGQSVHEYFAAAFSWLGSKVDIYFHGDPPHPDLSRCGVALLCFGALVFFPFGFGVEAAGIRVFGLFSFTHGFQVERAS